MPAQPRSRHCAASTRAWQARAAASTRSGPSSRPCNSRLVSESTPQGEALLAVDTLSKTFTVKRAMGGGGRIQVQAVRDVSFSLASGGSLGIVGESGSGKTTIARMLVGLERPTDGQIVLQGKELAAKPSRAERQERARVIQIV